MSPSYTANTDAFTDAQPEHFAFPPENIMLLTDDTSALSLLPTRENMIAGMQWLVGDAQPDDSLFFFLSVNT